jgi:hypothetical protein
MQTQPIQPIISRSILTASAAVLCAFLVTSAHADTFGSGLNQFTIDFVNIGNAGNGDDAGAGGSLYSSPYGGVPYAYRMGTYEISQQQVEKAAAGGLLNVTSGPWTYIRPAADMTWFEAAAFVNWLNTSKGHQAAYDLTWSGSAWSMSLWTSGQAWQAGGENLYRHKDAYYFLPSEDEWYKAAYHKNDGVTANYWDYATGSNSIPDGIDFNGDWEFDAVFYDGAYDLAHWVTNVGLASAYGTFGQNGNVWDWVESAHDGTNDSSTEHRVIRGGFWFLGADIMRSRLDSTPSSSLGNIGFRVASVPEPSSTVLMISAGLLAIARRRRRAAL